LTAVILTHWLGEPLKGDMSGILLYHIVSTAWSVPTNFPLRYCSETNIQPLSPCMLLLFSILHLYCTANSIVPRWLPHSVHPAQRPTFSLSVRACVFFFRHSICTVSQTI